MQPLQCLPSPSRTPLPIALALGTLLLSSTPGAYAQASSCALPSGNFAAAATINGICSTVSAGTADAFINLVQNDAGLASWVKNYTTSAALSGQARVNGAAVSLSSATNSNSVTFSIPSLSYSKTFSGTSRDAALSALADDLKKGDVLNQLLKVQSQSSPTSPITGVGGVVPTAISNDFNANFVSSATKIASGPIGGTNLGNLIGAGLMAGSFKTTGELGDQSTVRVTTLPLSYTVRNDMDPRRQLMLSLPISVVDVNGARSYAGGLGVGYRVPMDDNWTLVPSARVSAAGSTELGAAAGLATAGLTSVYVWDFDSYSVAMGNMVSYNSTLKLSVGDYSVNPNLKTTALRNGLMVSQPISIEGSRLAVEYSVIDTRYVGSDKPFIDNFQEYGITIGTNKDAASARSFLRGGLTYTHGKGMNGISANIGYWF